MDNPLTRKLGTFIDLTEADRHRLDELCAHPRDVVAGRDLIKEGDRPEDVFLIVQGWACRYKVLPSGNRQILSYSIPGDLCDVHAFILRRMDHSIGLLSDARVVAIPQVTMTTIIRESPAIAQGLLWATLVDEAVAREWLVNIGQRDAYERLAHLFCELWLRMHQVGLTQGGAFAFPLTQEQLGDTEGLTSVHVNRTLQRMRSEGLISLEGKRLTIHDLEGLKRLSGFNPNYLHLERRR